MDLLNYTKNLYKKIKYYDQKAGKNNFQPKNPNPFSYKEPIDITIIWVQNNDKKL
jgi:hypothetical protein